MTDEPLRPNPDRLLEHAATAHRGKLKVFFGACAGVGKTFAMLQEAQRLRAQGLDILIGVVETHGRKETAALLNGLATQPARRIHHRSRLIQEFDLDAALARRPALILMDELAHSNAHGFTPSETLAGCGRAAGSGDRCFYHRERSASGKP